MKSLLGRHFALLLTIATGVAIVFVVGAGILELDPAWNVPAGADAARDVLRQHGPLAAVGLLYLEESGVPMPVPGDFFVMYLGHRVAGDWISGILAWLALTIAVVLGSTNLYWISRRWGRRLVAGRAGAMMHLAPGRIERAERWFGRWGPWALIVGRHIPGFRVPITVAAGSFSVSFRTFALCVGISTATWSAFFLLIGNLLGERAQAFMDVHQTATPMIFAAILAVGVVYLMGRWVVTRRHDDVAQTREARGGGDRRGFPLARRVLDPVDDRLHGSRSQPAIQQEFRLQAGRPRRSRHPDPVQGAEGECDPTAFARLHRTDRLQANPWGSPSRLLESRVNSYRVLPSHRVKQDEAHRLMAFEQENTRLKRGIN